MRLRAWVCVGCLSLVLAAGAQEAQKPVIPADAVRLPENSPLLHVLEKPAPTFSPLTRSPHGEGDVQMAIVIGVDGKVESVPAVSGTKQLQQPSIDCVKRWTYKPYLVDGVAKRVVTIVTIHYR